MYPYSGVKLLELLERQHKKRATNDLFKSGIFTLDWRTKVGSFPHPDLETIIAAGEPCGAWKTVQVNRPERDNRNRWIDRFEPSRPEDKRNVGENNQEQAWPKIPLYGYIPAASIRGIVRAWAKQHPSIQARMQELLGWQDDTQITAGKIEFLDAFPEEPTKLSLDIVNPQQDFQVFHQGQSKPLSLYTLGDGHEEISVKIAIQGIAGRASAAEVLEVWDWVQQALSLHGLGARNASGYGAITAPSDFRPPSNLPKLPAGYSSKVLSFTLYSQGNAGPNMSVAELRPSHWRGWLRSWLLRFLLGVMSVDDAKYTVGELLGTLQDSIDGTGRKGCVSLKLTPGNGSWGEYSESGGFKGFYKWQGKLKITAPKEILTEIILPIMKFAVMVGGVGRGWRRPLHLFMMERRDRDSVPSARGCHVTFTHEIKSAEAGKFETKSFGISSKSEIWLNLYNTWASAAQRRWPQRYQSQLPGTNAEVFSPRTCAIYQVPGVDENPLDLQNLDWSTDEPLETRGDGMKLIYRPTYKRQTDVGGNAGARAANCSWVSIKRSGKQETVCIFMGQDCPLRRQFLQDLHNIPRSSYLFGVKPPQR
jgi:CRISPR-associated protein Cmr6